MRLLIGGRVCSGGHNLTGITMTVFCSKCSTNSIELPDSAALAPDFRFTCRECTQGSSMLEGMTQAAILGSKLARRVASGLNLLPKRKERTAERIQKWRTANKRWTRVYKMLLRVGVEITKSRAAEFTERWLAKVEAVGNGCSFCGAACEPDTMQFWRDPNGDPLDPQTYWPACSVCAARKRAEVRWKKAA
jgi:hypothetical protein